MVKDLSSKWEQWRLWILRQNWGRLKLINIEKQNISAAAGKGWVITADTGVDCYRCKVRLLDFFSLILTSI